MPFPALLAASLALPFAGRLARVAGGFIRRRPVAAAAVATGAGLAAFGVQQAVTMGGGWWRRWARWASDPAQAPATRIDRRRYADHVDDRVRSLQKGCGELHTAAHKALVEQNPWRAPRSTTLNSGTMGPYVSEWLSRATVGVV